ncbi:hypothetical protein F5Y08DRAFT_313751 [Xylaria arbuscula]|nr:hypothetical protein F5Y08DRAFT_313751 [Xylaria arbuscula]
MERSAPTRVQYLILLTDCAVSSVNLSTAVQVDLRVTRIHLDHEHCLSSALRRLQCSNLCCVYHEPPNLPFSTYNLFPMQWHP